MSTAIGQEGEDQATEYLQAHGFKIMARNWKNRWCEIDIVAKKDKSIHFVEVKYRKSAVHGSGFDYITPKKLKQMRFAAQAWVGEHKWDGDFQLDAVEIDGVSGQLVYLENVSI